MQYDTQSLHALEKHSYRRFQDKRRIVLHILTDSQSFLSTLPVYLLQRVDKIFRMMDRDKNAQRKCSRNGSLSLAL